MTSLLQNFRGTHAPPRAAGRALAARIGGALAVLLLVCLPHSSRAQTLYTLMTNGPASNRLNIVIFSEAYDASDLAANFLTDASNVLNNLFGYQPYSGNHQGYQPYQEYRSYFNAYAIAVASTQSGSSHPAYPVTRNTYFNSSYDLGDYIITIPPNTSDTNYSHGQGKVDALLASLMPRSGLTMMVVNDSKDGGSGGPLSIVSSYDSSYEPEITGHESGHTLGKLGDEYSYAYSDIAPITNSQPNTTQTTNLASIKWAAWIPTNTPIPTEETDQQYAGVVGCFQGANYNSNGWYRPQLDCIMKDLDNEFGEPLPFCKVCTEALVKAVYQQARPIDAFSPATNTVTVSNTQAVAFSITPLQPATHSLSVQWLTNGVAVPGATNAGYTFLPQNFTNGTYTLQAQVHDPTTMVRNDPSNLLGASVSWTVNVSVSKLLLDSARWLGNGQFSFRLSGAAPHGFVIQYSTNLPAWLPLSTNNLTNGQFIFTNTAAPTPVRRFYRAAILP